MIPGKRVPTWLVSKKEINKVTFSGDWDKNKTKKSPIGELLVITFNPLLKYFGNTIHKNLYLLYLDQRAQSVFFPGTMKTLRKARKLSKCFKQYVGKTVGKFCRRWNNYKSNDRKFQRVEPCMQEHLFSHFSMAGHDGFLNDASITFIDKTYPSDPLKREDHLRQRLKSVVSYGLDIEDSVWWIMCLRIMIKVCFKDYDFRIAEFVLLVYIVASVVVSVLSLLLLILLSFLLFVLVLLLLLLSLCSHYLFGWPLF